MLTRQFLHLADNFADIRGFHVVGHVERVQCGRGFGCPVVI
jgi:hypothetical protein